MTEVDAFLAHRALPVNDNLCFLCGASLTEWTRTEEDVFPEWLQRRHHLSAERVILLNGTRIYYRQLCVPCCKPCKSQYLRTIERRVEESFTGGLDSLVSLSPHTLFQWLAKIWYGLLYTDLSSPVDPSRSDRTPIRSDDVLRTVQLHHLLLQSVRTDLSWASLPASIRLFKTKQSGEPTADWDYSDDLEHPFLALRSGEIGILASLQDWGASFRVRWPKYEQASRLSGLAPLQFRELIAHGQYQTGLCRFHPRIMMVSDSPTSPVRLVLPELPPEEVPFGRWDARIYRRLLARALGIPYEATGRGERTITYLCKEDGSPMEVEFGAVPATQSIWSGVVPQPLVIPRRKRAPRKKA